MSYQQVICLEAMNIITFQETLQMSLSLHLAIKAQSLFTDLKSEEK